ncbi:MAG: IS200/IS605 family transposase [Candidatus Omnitrophota bacterium]|nr:IS200/IS605 family transposase [Candidatus Omnitrophota bacterium]
MKDRYRRSPHVVYTLKYHFVWITKYRYRMIEGWMKEYLKKLISQICDDMGIVIEEAQIGKEHLHMCLSVPPKYSPSEVMKQIKGITSERLFEEFPELKKTYWGKHFWARGYFVSSVGIDENTIKQYIKNQREDTSDNQMKIWK